MSHVVILGAGASRAAFPDGDRTGRKLPVMADLAELLDLAPLIRRHGFSDAVADFETLFSSLYECDPHSALVAQSEDRIREYFSALELPDTCTIYDRLVLALQPRDVIATFNWDPLLFLAYRRNLHVGRLPKLLALHGSVAVGACDRHRSMGFLTGTCHECGKAYEPVQLLYPIRRKNYQGSGFIAANWDMLRSHIQSGYWITIFGYGAPETDVEAVSLLSEMAAENKARDIGDVEIIDIKPRAELMAKWEPFFVRSHYAIYDSFARSILARHPRRSAEVLWMQTQELVPQTPAPFPTTNDLRVLQEAAKSMHPEEEEQENRRKAAG